MNNEKLLVVVIQELQNDIRHLDTFIRDHMKNEEMTIHTIDKRLSKLEWKAHGMAALFGIIGSVCMSKFRAIFGVDSN